MIVEIGELEERDGKQWMGEGGRWIPHSTLREMEKAPNNTKQTECHSLVNLYGGK